MLARPRTYLAGAQQKRAIRRRDTEPLPEGRRLIVAILPESADFAIALQRELIGHHYTDIALSQCLLAVRNLAFARDKRLPRRVGSVHLSIVVPKELFERLHSMHVR